MSSSKQDLTRSKSNTTKVSRRNFVKGAATIATVAAAVPLKSTAAALRVDFGITEINRSEPMKNSDL